MYNSLGTRYYLSGVLTQPSHMALQNSSTAAIGDGASGGEDYSAPGGGLLTPPGQPTELDERDGTLLPGSIQPNLEMVRVIRRLLLGE